MYWLFSWLINAWKMATVSQSTTCNCKCNSRLDIKLVSNLLETAINCGFQVCMHSTLKSWLVIPDLLWPVPIVVTDHNFFLITNHKNFLFASMNQNGARSVKNVSRWNKSICYQKFDILLVTFNKTISSCVNPP